MRPLVFRTTSVLLAPLLLLFAIFLVLHGHDEPGGGFVGGLVASAAFAVLALGEGVDRARTALRARPRAILGVGLLVAAGSGVVALFRGAPFLDASWGEVFGVQLGTPLLFDVGVALVVFGATTKLIFDLAEGAFPEDSA